MIQTLNIVGPYTYREPQIIQQTSSQLISLDWIVAPIGYSTFYFSMRSSCGLTCSPIWACRCQVSQLGRIPPNCRGSNRRLESWCDPAPSHSSVSSRRDKTEKTYKKKPGNRKKVHNTHKPDSMLEKLPLQQEQPDLIQLIRRPGPWQELSQSLARRLQKFPVESFQHVCC